jgi:hypothetical protein
MTMFEIPDKAWLPAGAVIAAFITGLISLVNMLIAKDQKITEFRQAWIDSLRAEVAKFIASATAIPVTGRLIDYKQSHTESQSDAVSDMTDYSKEALPEFINGYNKIILLLNPGEHKKLIDYLGALKNAAKMSSRAEQHEVEAKCCDVLHETQKILKEEWERVKRGERMYWVTKRFIVALVALLLTVGAVGVWYAMNTAPAPAMQAGKK